ncbi:uncharacterized protein B0H18DRAFT_1117968 [Fomitopsis serialis]|uniref:uncharacterized protein n=1 Tax=Fomitopsis serialis TaxID=139415 RepID=UPI00200894A9|nr:uncharacterized protein B0H18DRAFT_1117968 [Neoantrodia serialis]KAH9928283.1 hypothetical protein B0H18DRAFT_1117968 [Neoantrodia serialis]
MRVRRCRYASSPPRLSPVNDFCVPGQHQPSLGQSQSGIHPPSQLHQWKQQQERVHDFSPSPPPDRRPQPEPRPAVLRKNSAAPASPPSNTNHSHSRSFSAFSLFKARHPQENPPSPPPPADDDPVNLCASTCREQTALSRLSSADAPTPPLHPEIRSIVQLTLAHAHKIYFSGPLVKRVERQPDGQKPTRDEAIEEASKQGKQVPPTYINVTDSFVNVLGSLTMSSTPGGPPTKFTNVITVNTAGSNLLLFACPSPQVLVSWASAFRLSAWEKSRLEEIYTAHLIRITLNDGRDAPSPLVNGKMEGWVRIRIAGQVDWKRMWMVVSVGGHPYDGSSVSSVDHRPGSPTTPRRKKRISDLFVKERSPTRAAPPAKPIIHLVASPKPKDRKQPLLTMSAVTQAFAVYPERPELISRSTLMKLEGIFGEEEMAGGMKLREGWLMVLPEFEGSNIRASEMLRWLIALHDTFELYGRPRQYSWDPRDPRSMMFAYPIGPQRDMLFLDRELAETLDVRDERTSTIRSQLQNILADRMRGTQEHSPIADKPPVLPPLPDASSEDLNANGKATRAEPPEQPKPREEFAMQLPPLDFSSEEPPTVPEKRVLTPITERSTSRDPSRSLSFEEPASKQLSSQVNSPPRIAEAAEEDNRVLGEAIVISPTATTPPPLPPIPIQERGRRNPSFEVFRPQPKAQRPELDRPASKSSLGYLSTAPQTPSMQAPTSTPGPEARPAASAQASPPPAKPPTSPPAPTSPVDRPAPTRFRNHFRTLSGTFVSRCSASPFALVQVAAAGASRFL